MYLFFARYYVALKIETIGKMEGKVTVRLKKSFSNHWSMVRLNLSSDDVKNCKETTTFVKERNLHFGV